MDAGAALLSLGRIKVATGHGTDTWRRKIAEECFFGSLPPSGRRGLDEYWGPKTVSRRMRYGTVWFFKRWFGHQL